MFPSSGLFHHFACPTAFCQRPFCFYEHAEARESLCSAGLTGGQLYAAGRVPTRKEECLHELERINKEIEMVTNLVEQDQRRLSSYQNRVATSRSCAAHESGTAGQSVLSSRHSDLPLEASKNLTRKYVVDNSKPKTDLEYDPQSNYSSDLSSNHSSWKAQRTKSNEHLKDTTTLCDQKNPLKIDKQDSYAPSPEPFDESYEESELVIDLSPSPPKETLQAQKADVSVECKSSGKIDIASTLSQVHLENATVSKGNQQSASNNQKCKTKIANRGVIAKLKSLATLPNKHKASTLKSTVLSKVKKNIETQTIESDSNNPQCEPQQLPKKSLLSPEDNLQHSRSTEAQPKSSFVKKSVISVMSESPKESIKGSGPTKNNASITHSSPSGNQKQAAQSSAMFHTQEPSLKSVITCLPKKAEISSKNTEQLSIKAPSKDCIIISSDEEDGLKYTDLDLSDSDPMEECYRIFVEAKEEEEGKHASNISASTKVDDAVKPQSNATLQVPQAPVKRRLAHEVTHLEPLAKSRPQPQVLVPLRSKSASSFSSYTSSTPRIQQAQQRASMVTASVKAGQAFVSCKNKLETQSTSVHVTPILQTIPAQNVGRTIINMGNNLQILLPEGSVPLHVDSSSGPVTSVLTPISRVQSGSYTANRVYLQSVVTPVPRNVSTAPVLIPAPPRKRSATPNSNSTSSNVSSDPPSKRKRKNEDAKEKVPHAVRQQCVNQFTEAFLLTTANVNEAFEKALAEENSVYNRSINKLKYQSVAVNILKKLRNQNAFSVKIAGENKVNNKRLKGNISLNPDLLIGTDDMALYECLKDYILTDDKLIESNYPIQHPEKPGCAILLNNKKVPIDSLKRICCRCGATYSVTPTGKHARKEECTYHYGKGLTRKVPGGVETRYSCCEGIMGAPGCQVSELHVHDFLSLEGFVTTPSGFSHTNRGSIFSLDCEMCYTIHGLELSRVTVVNSNLQVVYDTFVKPENIVIDFNTRFSGISEEKMKGNYPSFKEVQNTLLSFISADTILIGHGLETDLCLLKLLHGKVIDTMEVFPHHLGPPHTLSLMKITADYLRKIIQESACGHDTEEDASACMELMLWKVKEDGKMKK